MGKIIIEPYLLALQENSVVIAWEVNQNSNYSLKYKKIGAKTYKTAKLQQLCIDNGNSNILYFAQLIKLEINNMYQYNIYEGKTIIHKNTFSTAKNSEKLKILTVGDTHSFELHEDIQKSIEKHQPNFILHSGDISFATGDQREQYEKNWFKLISQSLQQFPVYYTPGNHDNGKYFDYYFIKPIQNYVNHARRGNSYSINFNNTHFVFVDSNPWGLYEMNAINSDAQVDDTIQEFIDTTMEWLEVDLQSEIAQNSKWKILILHHPYTDVLNNKYISSIVDKYGIDLIISGHIHYYTKAITSNKNNKQSIYVSQGTLQKYYAEIEHITDKRLLEEFPEVVSIGKNNFGLLYIDKDIIQYDIYGYNELGEEKLIDTIKISHDLKELEISNVLVEHVDNIGTLKISGEIYNPNLSVAKAQFDLYDNGEKKNIALFGLYSLRHNILLAPHARSSFIAYYIASKAGEHLIEIANKEFNCIVFEHAQVEYMNFRCKKLVMQQGVYIHASIDIKNNIDREIYTNIPLFVNQHMIETKNIFLNPYQQYNIEFIYKVKETGKYHISIGSTNSKVVTIYGSIKLIPHVKDMSGNRHYGLIHGCPRLEKYKNNYQLCLDNDTDYIEIPAAKDLIANKGFTTIVSANIQRLANENEMGHNPLMVRGKSVGWGATYLFRMVVERSGILRWGICHDITEKNWRGGKIKLHKMARYALSFDKEHGGASYVDGIPVAYVEGISKESILRQWDDQPIFIGYSYIGHIIPELGRPKYYTHLNAKISEVKFYLDSLTEMELKSKSEKKDISTKRLAIDYDFSEILTIGSHTTEWKYLEGKCNNLKCNKKTLQFQQLMVNANIPFNASIVLTIEVSDNMVHLIDKKKVILKDGVNYIDLSDIIPAKHIRLNAKFAGIINEQGTFAPEIFEYNVSVTDGTYFSYFYWGTYADWARGKFTGAVHIPPEDRLAQYPEYTDIIHG